MTILLTGGCGFIGRNLSEALLKDGYDITVICKSIHDQLSGNIKYIQGDILNKNFVYSCFNKDIDTVIHLAGTIGGTAVVKNYFNDPSIFIDLNFESTKYIIEGARKNDSTILFSSSEEIYGKSRSLPWKENSDRVYGATDMNRWIFGTSKALSEHLLFSSARLYGIRTIIFRLSNIYGKFQKPSLVIPKMITSLLSTKKLQIYGNGLSMRSFTYIDDAVKAINGLIKDKSIKMDVFNIGSNEETTIKDLAQKIITIIGDSNSTIEYINPQTKLGIQYEDLQRKILDTSKIFKTIGWKATTSLLDGLNETIKWYKSNEEWWRMYLEKDTSSLL